MHSPKHDEETYKTFKSEKLLSNHIICMADSAKNQSLVTYVSEQQTVQTFVLVKKTTFIYV